MGSDKTERIGTKKRVFKVRHMDPGSTFLDYILLPVGYAYNAEWLSAKRGEKIKMFDGGTYTIYAVRKVKIESAAADILSRMRYGITIKACLQRWRMNAKLEGHTKSAVSGEECLWVIYERDDETSANWSDVPD